MSLPEYLRLTLYGQRVQRMTQLHSEPPQWVTRSLIYTEKSQDLGANTSSDEEGLGGEHPDLISITSPQRLYFDAHGSSSEHTLPTAWKLDGLHDQIIARNGTISVSHEVTENKEIMFIANHSIPALCGIWYYEVTLDEKSASLLPVMVGLCSSIPGRPIRYSGTQGQCWLYFSDDGRAMPQSGSARKYGPKFGPGDTIGCGVNFATQTVFYTKNGIDIGTAFKGVNNASIYPFISAHSGAIIHTNFGAGDFMFDIVNWVRTQKANLYSKIDAQPLDRDLFAASTDSSCDDEELMFGLVERYLEHMGYSKSLSVLQNQVKQADTEPSTEGTESPEEPRPDELSELLIRQNIRTYITNHQFDEVHKLLKDRWPHISREIWFELDCQKMAAAVRCEDIPRALEIGKSLQSTYGSERQYQEPLKLLYGTLAYPREEGGAPWEDERYGPRALAELVFKTIKAISDQEADVHAPQLPYLLKRTIEQIEDYVHENPEAALVNVFSDILAANGER